MLLAKELRQATNLLAYNGRMALPDLRAMTERQLLQLVADIKPQTN